MAAFGTIEPSPLSSLSAYCCPRSRPSPPLRGDSAKLLLSWRSPNWWLFPQQIEIDNRGEKLGGIRRHDGRPYVERSCCFTQTATGFRVISPAPPVSVNPQTDRL